MKYLLLIALVITSLCSQPIRKMNPQYKQNDTIYGEKTIKIQYKTKMKIDSIYIFDKKMNLMEKGVILKNTITFVDIRGNKTAIGRIENNNFEGNFLYFKDNRLFKSVNFKNGREEGMAIFFDKEGRLDMLTNYVNGVANDFSLIFEDSFPRYLRTSNPDAESTVFATFSKTGKIEVLSAPNQSESSFDKEASRAIEGIK